MGQREHFVPVLLHSGVSSIDPLETDRAARENKNRNCVVVKRVDTWLVKH